MNGTVPCLGDGRQHLTGWPLPLLHVEVNVGMGRSGKDEAPYHVWAVFHGTLLLRSEGNLKCWSLPFILF